MDLEQQLLTLRFESLAGRRDELAKCRHPLADNFLKKTKQEYRHLMEMERQYILAEQKVLAEIDRTSKCETSETKNK